MTEREILDLVPGLSGSTSHPAWTAFIEVMAWNKCRGWGATIDAWIWFQDGFMKGINANRAAPADNAPPCPCVEIPRHYLDDDGLEGKPAFATCAEAAVALGGGRARLAEECREEALKAARKAETRQEGASEDSASVSHREHPAALDVDKCEHVVWPQMGQWDL